MASSFHVLRRAVRISHLFMRTTYPVHLIPADTLTLTILMKYYTASYSLTTSACYFLSTRTYNKAQWLIIRSQEPM